MEIEYARARGLAMARQGLTGERLGSVVEATKAAVGVFASAPPCYLSLAARVAGFRLADLDRELYAERSLVRVRSMHEMSFVLPVDDLPMILGATDAGGAKAEARILKLLGMDTATYEELSERVLKVLAEVPTASLAELRKHLGDDGPKELNTVVALMGRQCRVVRSEVRGGWRSDSYAYAAWESWTGSALVRIDAEQARAELARRYLWSYGPATAADLKWWAGWTVRETKAALALVDPVQVHVEGVPMLVLSEDADALAAAEPPSGVRLLPYWDALMMGYERLARQPRLVSEENHPLSYDKAGNGTSVVLVDGVAAGVWEFDYAKDVLAVRIAPFRDLGPRKEEVEAEAALLAEAVGATGLTVYYVDEIAPLNDGARNAFMAPIRLGGAAQASGQGSGSSG